LREKNTKSGYSLLITILDEVVSDFLNNRSSISWLLTFLIQSDQDGLTGLDYDASSRSLLSVNRSVISFNGEVFVTTDVNTLGEGISRVVEESSETLTFSWADLKARRSSPSVTVKTKDSNYPIFNIRSIMFIC
jgi:DNA polymerase III sliding clamp (beta) subunit (PCNA family)